MLRASCVAGRVPFPPSRVNAADGSVLAAAAAARAVTDIRAAAAARGLDHVTSKSVNRFPARVTGR
jgi:hypothetical protein